MKRRRIVEEIEEFVLNYDDPRLTFDENVNVQEFTLKDNWSVVCDIRIRKNTREVRSYDNPPYECGSIKYFAYGLSLYDSEGEFVSMLENIEGEIAI